MKDPKDDKEATLQRLDVLVDSAKWLGRAAVRDMVWVRGLVADLMRERSELLLTVDEQRKRIGTASAVCSRLGIENRELVAELDRRDAYRDSVMDYDLETHDYAANVARDPAHSQRGFLLPPEPEDT